MNIFPAIDIIEGKAVRLKYGDYDQKTIFNDDPLSVAKDFESLGAEYLHIVDLDAAKSGDNQNFETICNIVKNTNLFVQVGGGIRNEQIIQSYLDIGVNRLILGTIAAKDQQFVSDMVKKFGEHIAVGADIKNNFISTHGWLQLSKITLEDFCLDMQSIGVTYIICTDISKDGAMMGANHQLYESLNCRFNMQFIASGGVSSLEDIKILSELGLYGAIIGKAYYTKAIDLKEAIKLAKETTC